MNLESLIRNVKPSISDSSLRAYIGNLNILNKSINNNSEITSLDFLKNPKKIMDILEKKAMSTKKNYLVAIIVALQSDKDKYQKVIDIYNKYISELQDKILDNYDNNEKSEKQEKNWVEYDEIKKLVNKYKKEANTILNKNTDKYNNKDLQKIQDYLLLALYSGKFFAPIRNDYIMEIINDDETMDDDKNYLVIGKNFIKFVFREFKTKKSSEDREVLIKNKELIDLIMRWIEITNSDNLLINIKDKKAMSSNGITKNLNRIFQKEFGKNVSSSLLRSIYISHMYDNNKMTIKDKKKLANEMMHSIKTATTVYDKID